MNLLTKDLTAKLIANRSRRQLGGSVSDLDHRPVVKFFNPCGAGTWLFSELDEDGDTLFGLCDLGMGSPELGYASLSELASTKLSFGLGIERDRNFRADKTLTEYATQARASGELIA